MALLYKIISDAQVLLFCAPQSIFSIEDMILRYDLKGSFRVK